MDKKDQILQHRIPKHIAVIMDGNGRWAKKKGMLRIFGHENGTKAVKATIESVAELGIPYVTLYAFSTENWNRPKGEIDKLMSLLVSTLNKELSTLQEHNIRLNAIGNLDALPENARERLLNVINLTKENKKVTLTLALSYGAREEIVNCVKVLSDKVKNNIISSESIDESVINNHLYTQNLPDVDLLIRTSGEQRISNFLLWQIAYAELYFTDVLWPDFTKDHMFDAIIDYQNRERRFGKTSEQINE